MNIGATSGTTGTKTPSIWSGFFGKVAGGIGTGLEQVGTTVLPNWAAGQVSQQAVDQLQTPTYDRTAAPSRVETAIGEAGRIVETPLFKVGGFAFKTQHALMGVAGLLAVWLAIRLGR